MDGITNSMRNKELYTHKIQKIIYLCLFTYWFRKGFEPGEMRNPYVTDV